MSMKYDVVIVGAGPCGYFAAYELSKINPNKKVLLIDRGRDITQRNCPVINHKLDKCPANKDGRRECSPACSITSGFGGSGAYSDGKFNITTEFGGWLTKYISDDENSNFYLTGVGGIRNMDHDIQYKYYPVLQLTCNLNL